MKPTHRIEYSRPADADVAAILVRLFGFDPDWAADWNQNLQHAVGSLEFLPELYGFAPEAEAVGRPIRQLVFGKRRNRYRVLYEVRGSVVTILRVRHGAQDFLTSDEI
jgi:plasmid stabilization system protein ParE